jgi:hypothetical protein
MASSHLVLSIEEELAKNPHSKVVPERFVRPVDHQDPPGLLGALFPAIPTVDMKKLVSVETKDSETDKLKTTCMEWGLFQVDLLLKFFLIFFLVFS